MKVCILSDSHDHIALIDAAAADAKTGGAEAILHCGDLVAPSTLHCLEKYGLPVHLIHGNNTGDLYALTQLAHKPGGVVRFHGMD
ncbi:MAG: metallophosphoesterase family protein, partial [Sedimenticolaceae bacterium]